MAYFGGKSVTAANVPLLKKAKQLGNQYSDSYCKQSASRQLLRQRMDLIKLVDDEIHETQQKLYSLRIQLINSTRTEQPKTVLKTVLAGAEDNQRVNTVCAKTVVAPRRQPMNGDKSIDSAISSCSSSDQLETVSMQTIPKQVWTDGSSKIINSPVNTCNSAHNFDEERYFAKLKKIFQNREGVKQIASDPKHSNERLPSADHFTKLFVDDIVEKICDKLQRIKPVQEPHKELKSVAIETTFANADHNEESDTSSDNSVCDLALENMSDETVYLHLPAKCQKVKSNRRQATAKETSFINADELTQYKELKATESELLVEVDLIRNSLNASGHYSGGLNYSDITCHTSMFKTLPEISSNCFTPKGPLPSSEQTRNESLSFTPAHESSCPRPSITEFTIDTSMELSALDKDQFWKDVFHTAGIAAPGDTSTFM